MSHDKASIVDAAIAEIDERQLESTADFLARHDVRRTGGLPLVALVRRGSDAIWSVTFELENVPYYLTITLEDQAGVLVPVIALSSPGSTVDFVVRSTEVAPEAVTRILGLPPAVTRVMGELHKGQRTRHPHHEWCYAPDVLPAEDPGNKVDRLLHDLGTVREQLLSISDRVEAELRVWYEGFQDQTTFFALTDRQVQVLASLKASFLINCVLSGPDVVED